MQPGPHTEGQYVAIITLEDEDSLVTWGKFDKLTTPELLDPDNKMVKNEHNVGKVVHTMKGGVILLSASNVHAGESLSRHQPRSTRASTLHLRYALHLRCALHLRYAVRYIVLRATLACATCACYTHHTHHYVPLHRRKQSCWLCTSLHHPRGLQHRQSNSIGDH
jgi:hypothetical protein